MERVRAARWAGLSLRRGHADDVPWNSRPRNLCKTRITVATHLQNVDGGFAATGVDALSLNIDEEVVGVAAGLCFRGDTPAWAGERNQCRRAVKHGQNALCARIDLMTISQSFGLAAWWTFQKDAKAKRGC